MVTTVALWLQAYSPTPSPKAEHLLCTRVYLHPPWREVVALGPFQEVVVLQSLGEEGNMRNAVSSNNTRGSCTVPCCALSCDPSEWIDWLCSACKQGRVMQSAELLLVVITIWFQDSKHQEMLFTLSLVPRLSPFVFARDQKLDGGKSWEQSSLIILMLCLLWVLVRPEHRQIV